MFVPSRIVERTGQTVRLVSSELLDGALAGVVRELACRNGGQLTRGLDAIAAEVDAWREEYGVESLSELRGSVGRDDLTESARSERIDAVAEWEYDVEMREAIRLAISLQESLATLEPLAGANG